jgi:hypothetical protein
VDLGKLDDAWRCIDEAMTAMQTSKERWCEAEVHRIAGEIALKSSKPDMASQSMRPMPGWLNSMISNARERSYSP